jgi:hypothetical protein
MYEGAHRGGGARREFPCRRRGRPAEVADRRPARDLSGGRVLESHFSSAAATLLNAAPGKASLAWRTFSTPKCFVKLKQKDKRTCDSDTV